MTLSAEYCCEKTGDQGGGEGILAHQRRLIKGLLVWVSLLTLGLATLITLHFLHTAPHKPKDSHPNRPDITPKNSIEMITFTLGRDNAMESHILQWSPMRESFIEGKENLTVTKRGEYFLYLQVTLYPPKNNNHTITVQTNSQRLILKGSINGSNLSTGFMGTAITMNDRETITVTCKPKAKIHNSHTETYLGVIKLS